MKPIVIESTRDAKRLHGQFHRSKKLIFAASKRITDIILSIILAVLTVLIFPFIAIAIEIESPGPIFFRQKRVGKNGKIFELIKFRSTYRTQVDESTGFGEEGDHIFTNVGKFLRKSYLDELPQVINVFRGEMSLIGPRPERPEFVEIFKKEIPFYQLRLLVRPGLTGWAQVNMENRAFAHEAAEKLKYDLYYIKNRSILLELRIILMTFRILSRRTGR